MWEVANLGTPWLGQAMKWYCVTLNGSVSSSSACNEQKDERVRSLITVHSKAGPAIELFDHVPGPSIPCLIALAVFLCEWKFISIVVYIPIGYNYRGKCLLLVKVLDYISDNYMIR